MTSGNYGSRKNDGRCAYNVYATIILIPVSDMSRREYVIKRCNVYICMDVLLFKKNKLQSYRQLKSWPRSQVPQVKCADALATLSQKRGLDLTIFDYNFGYMTDFYIYFTAIFLKKL